MEDCLFMLDSLHVLMGACFICGCALGAIGGMWFASRSLFATLEKEIQEIDGQDHEDR